MNEPVYWAKNICPVINVTEIEDYKKQAHLLEDKCKTCIAIFSLSDKIIKIQTEGDNIPYVLKQDPPILHNNLPYEWIHSIKKNEKIVNEYINDHYYSAFTINDIAFYICHKTALSDSEIDSIENITSNATYLHLVD